MNIKASKMTFCVTCVVERMVVTHFRNPIEGFASDTRGVVGRGVILDSSTRWRVKLDSNQNRQVILESLALVQCYSFKCEFAN